MQRLTLEALEVLDAVDRKGSYAAAADALYKVQSKVSYTIKKLEQDIGVSLFEKEGRRAVLTPAGRVLLEQGRDLLQAAERIVENTRQTATGWESCLNITLDSILSINILLPLFDAFDGIHPNIEINLYEEVLGGNWDAIINGKSDLVIGAPEPPFTTQGLEIKEIGIIDWVFAVSKHHPLVSLNKVLNLEDISQYKAVVARDSSKHLPPLTKRVLDKQTRLVVPTLDMKIQTQVAGAGVGFLPRCRIENHLKEGSLVELKLQQPATSTPMYMVWRKSNKGKALHWFVNKLSDYFDQIS